MALTELYNGRTVERDINGINTIVTYFGSKSDCESWAASHTINATYTGLGRLASITISQAGGAIYNVTAKYENANGTSGGTSTVIPPDYAFGQKSGSLDGTMMSTPLEIHKNASGQYDYLWNWNHYLIGKKAVGASDPAIPAWWSTLGANASTGELALIPSADQETYQWIENGIVPQETGYQWVVLKPPTMPGYQSYDRALYTWTESARYRDLATALSMVSSQVNKRGTPTYLPSNTPFVAGNWKCDRATVDWTGEYWRATLTWTYSPDGWNATLYQSV